MEGFKWSGDANRIAQGAAQVSSMSVRGTVGGMPAGAAWLPQRTIAGITSRACGNRAARRNPPSRRFIDVDGVRLHYSEHGEATHDDCRRFTCHFPLSD